MAPALRSILCPCSARSPASTFFPRKDTPLRDRRTVGLSGTAFRRPGRRHATPVVAGGLGILIAIAFGLWLVFRPKPEPIIPPEVQARQALEMLRQQPEDGAVLSRVSQAMRNYFIATFQLPTGEFTTTEFRDSLSGHEQIGVDLSTAVTSFLRDCDARKFSTATALAPLQAVDQALNLVAQAEQRLAQLCQTAATQTQGRGA